MNEIIYLEPDEEITAVIDRLKLTMSRLAVLVIPRGSALAQSIVNLKLLKRTADGLSKEVALVSNDRITRNLASQVGITVYSKVSEAEKARPNMVDKDEDSEKYGAIRVNKYDREEEESSSEPIETIEEDDGIGKEPSMETRKIEPRKESSDPKMPTVGKAPMPHHFQRKSYKKLFIILTPIILVLIAAALVFLPTVNAKIEVKTEDYLYDGMATVNRNIETINSADASLPGKLYQLEKEFTKTFNTTGIKEAGEKAKGKMTVLNTNDTGSHKYAAGTKFIAKGKSFLADAEFTVPGATIALVGGEVKVTAGEISVNVTAEGAGDTYNIGASDYVIGGAPSKIYGQASAMTGGVTKVIKIVSDKDLVDAEKSVSDELANQAKVEILEQVKSDQETINETGLVSDTISATHSKNTNDETETFDTTVKIKYSGLGYKDQDMKNLLWNIIEEKLGSGKMLVNPDKSEITFSKVETDENVETSKMTLNYKGKIADKADIGIIAESIKNKKIADAEIVILKDEKFEGVTFSKWPAFWNRTPLLKYRIKVSFDYAK